MMIKCNLCMLVFAKSKSPLWTTSLLPKFYLSHYYLKACTSYITVVAQAHIAFFPLPNYFPVLYGFLSLIPFKVISEFSFLCQKIDSHIFEHVVEISHHQSPDVGGLNIRDDPVEIGTMPPWIFPICYILGLGHYLVMSLNGNGKHVWSTKNK